jgi:hypothetical protein
LFPEIKKRFNEYLIFYPQPPEEVCNQVKTGDIHTSHSPKSPLGDLGVNLKKIRMFIKTEFCLMELYCRLN